MNLKKLIIFLALASTLYGFLVLGLVSSVHWFNFMGIIVGLGLGILALAWKGILGLPRWVKALFLAMLFVGLLGFLVLESQIILKAQETPTSGATYVIVLGAKVNGSQPSLTLSRRIQVASQYLLENPEAKVIATGGQGPDQGIPESLAIVRGLTARGVEPHRIMAEEKSTTTKENLIYALERIEGQGGTADDSVIIVSSAFHLFRAQLLAEKIGYTSTQVLGSSSLLVLVPHYYAREAAALISEKLNHNI